MAEFLRQSFVNPLQYTWLIVGRFGTPILPHVFCAARLQWVYDKGDMNLSTAALASVQLVPGGDAVKFADTLAEFVKRAGEKRQGEVYAVADLTRSIELRDLIWKRAPLAALMVVTPGQDDQWTYPARRCGRPLMLSRLQSWLAERKISPALPATSGDDPNVLTWRDVSKALASAQAKPPLQNADNEAIMDLETTEDDVTLVVASLAWWAFTGKPSPIAGVIPDDVMGVPKALRR